MTRPRRGAATGKPYAHGDGVQPFPWQDGGYHVYHHDSFVKRSYSAASLGSHNTVPKWRDPQLKQEAFQGLLARARSDANFLAATHAHYATLMRQKTDKDIDADTYAGRIWRGTRRGLDHPSGCFSYVPALVPARPQTAPPGTRRQSQAALVQAKWLAGPWKDAGPCGGKTDEMPRKGNARALTRPASARTRAQSSPPTLRA